MSRKPAPLRDAKPPFQGGSTGSNPVGGTERGGTHGSPTDPVLHVDPLLDRATGLRASESPSGLHTCGR
jgi:hypothetical protein